MTHYPISIIDGGYLTWVFGTMGGGNWGGWSGRRHRLVGHLVMLDDEPLWRAKVFPGYKIKRSEKKEKDPIYAAKRMQVNLFRSILEHDPELMLVRYPGMEADDVMAIFHLLFCPGRIVSLDKDLWQVPGFKQLMVDAHGISVAEGDLIRPRFPVYVHTFPKHFHESAHHVLIQTLLGDKSDSIPRLFPSHPGKAKNLWTQISSAESPFREAHNIFGDAFLRNLLVILIPSPALLKFYNGIQDIEDGPRRLFRLIETGEYWNKSQIVEEVRKWAKETLLQTQELMLEKRKRQRTTSLDWSDVTHRTVMLTLV